jgi:uncharacterized protein DUF559
MRLAVAVKATARLRVCGAGRGGSFRRQVQIGAAAACVQAEGLTAYGTIGCGGYGVLRFWNNDVLWSIDGVLSAIHPAITTAPAPNRS